MEQPISMNLDSYEKNFDQARTARPQSNMMIGVLPIRKVDVVKHSYDENVVISIANNNVSQDIIIPKAAWNEIRKCQCKFD